jgi:hypothetical protein
MLRPVTETPPNHKKAPARARPRAVFVFQIKGLTFQDSRDESKLRLYALHEALALRMMIRLCP